MDVIIKAGENPEPSYIPWKSAVFCATAAQCIFEVYIIHRQIRLLRRESSKQSNDESEKASLTAKGPLTGLAGPRYYLWSSFYRLARTSSIIYFDAIPKLWTLVSEFQEKNIPWELDDWLKSYLFMLVWFILFHVQNIPDFLYRTIVLKENVIRNYFANRQRNAGIHDVARGKPLPAAIVIAIFPLLQYKVSSRKIDGTFAITITVFQLLYAFIYPVFFQPRGKLLSIMESGETREAIKDLADNVKFPTKEIYVMDVPVDSIYSGFRIHIGRWPLKYNIVVPKEVVENYTTKDIVALLASELGAWKGANWWRHFFVAQVYFNLAITYVMIFIKDGPYTAFGFGDYHPKMAALMVFAVSIAPPMTLTIKLLFGSITVTNQAVADKFVNTNGYSYDFSVALAKAAETSTTEDVKIDRLYSLYYNEERQFSERIATLEKLDELRDGEKGAIYLEG